MESGSFFTPDLSKCHFPFESLTSLLKSQYWPPVAQETVTKVIHIWISYLVLSSLILKVLHQHLSFHKKWEVLSSHAGLFESREHVMVLYKLSRDFTLLYWGKLTLKDSEQNWILELGFPFLPSFEVLSQQNDQSSFLRLFVKISGVT